MKTPFVAALLAGGLIAGSAAAADLPIVQPYAAAAPVVHNWTGFYLGANVGYGWGDADLTFGGVGSSGDYDGFIGGLQAGYNHQFAGGIVVGLEADIQLSGVDYSRDFGGVVIGSELNYFGTARARLGYAFDRFLPYITGGVAFGQNEADFSFLGITVSDDNTHFGWTIGAGLEVAVTQNVSIKGEYLYVDFEDKTYFGNGILGGSFNAGADLHIARVGVNYKF